MPPGSPLLRKLGFGYMLSPMVAYTSRIIMQAIPARVIILVFATAFSNLFKVLKGRVVDLGGI